MTYEVPGTNQWSVTLMYCFYMNRVAIQFSSENIYCLIVIQVRSSAESEVEGK